jgi:S-adenosylmethionine:diacylglycerol 3-amino-3-carboxypropyl transferase
MYIYATELVGDYYERLGLAGKNVLTISGSGDQVLNLFLYKPSKVTAFDVNKWSYHMVSLKIAALKILSYKDFLIFFGREYGSGTFDEKLFRKIRTILNWSSRVFFYWIGRKKGVFGNEKFFRQREFIKVTPLAVNNYLKDRRTYDEAAQNVMPVTFIHSDVIDIVNKVNSKFDLINLSNVPNYLGGRSPKEEFLPKFENLLNKLHSILKPAGAIIYYSYDVAAYDDAGPLATRQETLVWLQSLETFNLEVVPLPSSALVEGGRDKLVVLKRKG